jgi:uncharacterized membrane protein (UPF0182 family)
MDTNPPGPVFPLKMTGQGRSPPASYRTLRLVTQYIIPGVILLLIVTGMVTGYLEKWLWMGQLHYTGIFWTMFSIEWTMYAVSFAIVFSFLWLNLRQALLNGGVPAGRAMMPRALVPGGADADELELTPHLLHSAIVIVSLAIAWFAANAFFGQWDTWLRFRYGSTFGVADPLHGIDVGFYVFHLPFYQMLQTSVMLLTVLTICGVGLVYSFFQAISLSRGNSGGLNRPEVSHLSVLLFIFVADWGIGLLLAHYELVYSTMGVVYGAGYTAANLTNVALWGMVILSVIACCSR